MGEVAATAAIRGPELPGEASRVVNPDRLVHQGALVGTIHRQHSPCRWLQQSPKVVDMPPPCLPAAHVSAESGGEMALCRSRVDIPTRDKARRAEGANAYGQRSRHAKRDLVESPVAQLLGGRRNPGVCRWGKLMSRSALHARISDWAAGRRQHQATCSAACRTNAVAGAFPHGLLAAGAKDRGPSKGASGSGAWGMQPRVRRLTLDGMGEEDRHSLHPVRTTPTPAVDQQ